MKQQRILFIITLIFTPTLLKPANPQTTPQIQTALDRYNMYSLRYNMYTLNFTGYNINGMYLETQPQARDLKQYIDTINPHITTAADGSQTISAIPEFIAAINSAQQYVDDLQKQDSAQIKKFNDEFNRLQTKDIPTYTTILKNLPTNDPMYSTVSQYVNDLNAQLESTRSLIEIITTLQNPNLFPSLTPASKRLYQQQAVYNANVKYTLTQQSDAQKAASDKAAQTLSIFNGKGPQYEAPGKIVTSDYVNGLSNTLNMYNLRYNSSKKFPGIQNLGQINSILNYISLITPLMPKLQSQAQQPAGSQKIDVATQAIIDQAQQSVDYLQTLDKQYIQSATNERDQLQAEVIQHNAKLGELLALDALRATDPANPAPTTPNPTIPLLTQYVQNAPSALTADNDIIDALKKFQAATTESQSNDAATQWQKSTKNKANALDQANKILSQMLALDQQTDPQNAEKLNAAKNAQKAALDTLKQREQDAAKAQTAALPDLTAVFVEWEDSGAKVRFNVGETLDRVETIFTQKIGLSRKFMIVNVNYAEVTDINYQLKSGDFVRIWPNALGAVTQAIKNAVNTLKNEFEKAFNDAKAAAQQAIQIADQALQDAQKIVDAAAQKVTACGEVIFIQTEIVGLNVGNFATQVASAAVNGMSVVLTKFADVTTFFTINNVTFSTSLNDLKSLKSPEFTVGLTAFGTPANPKIQLDAPALLTAIPKIVDDLIINFSKTLQ